MVTPEAASVMKITASASAIAISACARICAPSVNCAESTASGFSSFPGRPLRCASGIFDGSGSIPPVSTMSKVMPFHSASATRRSRVVPGTSSTTASGSPARRLKSVDLPTLGRPTMATRDFMRGGLHDDGRPVTRRLCRITCRWPHLAYLWFPGGCGCERRGHAGGDAWRDADGDQHFDFGGQHAFCTQLLRQEAHLRSEG